MPNLFKMECKTIVCDICRERPYKEVVEVSKGKWLGVCGVCQAKLIEAKNDNLLQNQAVK